MPKTFKSTTPVTKEVSYIMFYSNVNTFFINNAKIAILCGLMRGQADRFLFFKHKINYCINYLTARDHVSVWHALGWLFTAYPLKM